MPAPWSHLVARAARLCALLGLTLIGCGAKSPVRLPSTLAGQLPADYQLGQGRGVILARFTVATDGQPGFGGIGNPLLVEFRAVGVDPPDANPQGLSLPHPGARVWGSDRDLPTIWQYEDPGLMAASFRPASYDGLVIAYPDASESSVMPDSIPAPSQGLRFAAIELLADEVVYIGTIHIAQRYGFWDMALDRVHVEFSVSDDYDQSIADFRARYPQLAETPVHKRLATVVPPAP